MSARPAQARWRHRAWWHAQRRNALPLAALTAVAALVVSLTPGRIDAPWLLAGLGLDVLLLLAQLTRSPASVPLWGRGWTLLVCHLAFALTRHGAGGAASGLTSLAVLPVVGAGLYGRRRDLVLALAGGALAVALPSLLDPQGYPPATELRRALLWVLANTLVALTIHRLVSSQRRATAHLELVARTSRELSTAADPREAICRAAAEICDADVVHLLEREGPSTSPLPRGGGRSRPEDPRRVGAGTVPDRTSAAGWLVSTAVVGQVDGRPAPGYRIDLDLPSLTAEAFAGHRRGFVADLAAEPGVDEGLRAGLRAASATWQPVGTGAELTGLLVVVHQRRRDRPDPTAEALLAALAADAAVAIEREDLLAQAQRLATHDTLTGLANRHRWNTTAALEVAHARREGTPLTFALIDLDHFKRYNDTHGHLAGDRLLRDFARAAAATVREVDTLARWGGEEFALALPGCTAEDAVRTAARVHAAVPHGQSCTIGLAPWREGQDHHEVLAAADAALYRAKETRRGTTATA